MKRRGYLITGVLLLVILTLGGVASAKVKLQFLFADYRTEKWTQLTKDMVKEFNDTHPDIEIELIGGTQGYTNLEQKFRVFYAAGQQIDIYENHWNSTRLLAKDGVFLDLVPLMKQDGLYQQYAADYGPPGTFEAVLKAMGGKLVVLPSFGTIDAGMLYNRAMFDKSGLQYPAESWKWADFRNFAKKLSREIPGAANNKKQYGFLYEHNYIYQWLWQNDVFQMASQKPDESWNYDWKRPEARETFEFLAELFREGYAERFGSSRVKDLAAERGAMGMGLFTEVKDLRKLGVDASITRRPYNRTEVARIGEPWFNLHLVRTGDPQREAAAWEFLKWRSNKENDLRSAQYLGMFPWRQSNLRTKAFLTMLDQWDTRTEAYLMANYMFDRGRVIVEPLYPFKSSATPAGVSAAILNAITGKIPLSEALETSETTFFAQ